MSLDLNDWKADLSGMVDDLPVTFTSSGTEYTGTPDVLSDTDPLQAGGFMDTTSRTIVVPLQEKSGDEWVTTGADFIQIGQTVTIDSVDYKVTSKTRSQDGLAVTLVLALK